MLYVIAYPVEQVTFFLVVYLVSPFLKQGQEKNQNFRKFMYGGYKDRETFEKAIAENPKFCL